jgi:DNA-binding NarL/FixJ family response regulator
MSARTNLLPPRVLVVDDEAPAHAAVRLCLGKDTEVVSRYSPREMDGLQFIESAREIDPALGYVILSGFDSHDNLLRAVPLQVYDFIPKPLPQRSSLERLAPDWVEQTRERRKKIAYAEAASQLDRELEHAKIARDVESTASESARDALMQAANYLTTLRALLLSSQFTLETLGKGETGLSRIQRTVHEARRHADLAADVVENYFTSAYADRETSPARVNLGVKQALAISSRMAHADERDLAVDLSPLGQDLTISGLAGIELLMLLVPLLNQCMALAEKGTSLRLECQFVERLDDVCQGRRAEAFVWVNRRKAALRHPGVMVDLRTASPALDSAEVLAWVREERCSTLLTPSRGILHGLEKSNGLLGVSIKPASRKLQMLLGLPAVGT